MQTSHISCVGGKAPPAIHLKVPDCLPPSEAAKTPQPIDTKSLIAPGVASAKPPHIAPQELTAAPEFQSNLEGALWWFEFGYKVMPMVPGQKRPALPHYPWADEVTVDAIREHWDEYPEHEVGAILERDQLVLDADTAEANEALMRIENEFDAVPTLIIKTTRGYHHHYRLFDSAYAKADSHFTVEFPDRIDVRAAKNSILLTPSRGKAIHRLDVDRRVGLPAVGQDFIDAVFQHNGRPAPRARTVAEDREPLPTNGDLTTLSRLLEALDPDCGYQDWVSALMAIFHETGGSEAGLDLADAWSRTGKAYKGRSEVEAKWSSFSSDVSNPLTIASLVARAKAAGADVAEIMTEDFEPCSTETVVQPAAEIRKSAKASPLRKYSLIGQAAKYQELAQDSKPLLGDVCMSGEATIWYAKHNVGKTLLTLHLLTEAIEKGRIAAKDAYYINADDSSSGLAEKLGILDELGGHTLVPGQGGFKAEDLQELLIQAAFGGTARGTLVVIDTMKKFADLMNKRQASEFANACRQFVAAGGSVVGLAHTNKRKGDDGKPIHAGTSDILDDFDAGYIIDELEQVGSTGEKVIEFSRLKGRSGGVQSAAYAYAAEDGLSYAERLASVSPVDPTDLESFKRIEVERSDAEIISAIARCIANEVVTKMALRNAAAELVNVSRRSVMRVIERYTGDDPDKHRWSFARKARGAMSYSLLRTATEPEPSGSPVVG